MTDQTVAEPIAVKGHAAQVVAPEGFKLVATAVLAAIAARTLNSDTAVVAVTACGGIAAVGAWSVWERLKNWGALKMLANAVPDSMAFVRGKP